MIRSLSGPILVCEIRAGDRSSLRKTKCYERKKYKNKSASFLYLFEYIIWGYSCLVVFISEKAKFFNFEKRVECVNFQIKTVKADCKTDWKNQYKLLNYII